MLLRFSYLFQSLPCSVVPETVHILGERELNILYFCRMNVIVNAFILAFVNGALSQFNFVHVLVFY